MVVYDLVIPFFLNGSVPLIDMVQLWVIDFVHQQSGWLIYTYSSAPLRAILYGFTPGLTGPWSTYFHSSVLTQVCARWLGMAYGKISPKLRTFDMPQTMNGLICPRQKYVGCRQARPYSKLFFKNLRKMFIMPNCAALRL